MIKPIIKKTATLLFIVFITGLTCLAQGIFRAVDEGNPEMRGSIAASGTLYVDSDQYQDSLGGLDIYRTESPDSSFSAPVNLGPILMDLIDKEKSY